jgi:hypothetical protein
MRQKPDELTVEELLDRFKYHPRDLINQINQSPELRRSLSGVLDTALRERTDWPSEVANWRVLLVALLETSVGWIMDPYSRSSAHAELLACADDWGLTRSSIRMVSNDSFPILSIIKEQRISLPKGEVSLN